MGFKVALLPQQFSPSAFGVCSSQPPCRSPGNMCCVALDHGEVQERTHPKDVASLYVLQRKEVHILSFPRQSSTFQASPRNLCLVRQVPTIPSSISPAAVFSRQVSQLVSFLLQVIPHYEPHASFITIPGHMVES